ncbi:hypothetical protein WICPIJ_006619 [Wickerhamomyces pijperi]|uniref:Uncharacterized protein n=1 Tax=Wickerhamomyces pijperi TaxID=599730 RepID=A0A9P8Q1T2_WICPI|nr:hypothetical protein WICPIJ_006619 [Wickerhamomyces pijperi]
MVNESMLLDPVNFPQRLLTPENIPVGEFLKLILVLAAVPVALEPNSLWMICFPCLIKLSLFVESERSSSSDSIRSAKYSQEIHFFILSNTLKAANNTGMIISLGSTLLRNPPNIEELIITPRKESNCDWILSFCRKLKKLKDKGMVNLLAYIVKKTTLTGLDCLGNKW